MKDPALAALLKKLRAFAREKSEKPLGLAELRARYDAALELPHYPDAEEEIWRLECEEETADLPGWLLHLPDELAEAGRVDQAVHLCEKLADVLEGENFLTERAVILGEAGRVDAAVKAVDETVLEHPLSIARMGDAMRAAGEKERAQILYRQAEALDDDPWSRYDILEREIPLLREMGRTQEAEALESVLERLKRAPYDDEEDPDACDREPAFDEEPLPKVGRNSPCPCGSGKKFKTCCGK